MNRVARYVCTASILAAFLPSIVIAQNPANDLKDYTRMLGKGALPLSLVHVNPHTLPLLFQPPTLYAIRARSAESTMLYVQGTAQNNFDLDTTNFTIEQGGESISSTPMNIKHFENAKKVSVPKGDRVDGMLLFAKHIDLSKPFVVKHGADSVEFKFNAAQLKAIAPPAAQP